MMLANLLLVTQNTKIGQSPAVTWMKYVGPSAFIDLWGMALCYKKIMFVVFC